MVIKTIDSIAKDSVAKNMTDDSTAKNSTAKNTVRDYYFHNNKRSRAKNNVSVITKLITKGKATKICGYDEKGLLVGWGINSQALYSRVDNECIAGWFKMMCDNDNLVVGEILRSVEEYKLRHSKAKHNAANAENIKENNKESNKENKND